MGAAGLIVAQALISIVGLLIHLKVHPTVDEAAVAGVFDVVVVTLLCCWKKTVPLAFLFNGLLVIIGIIFMVDFSIQQSPGDLYAAFFTAQTSTLMDCVILIVDFLIVRAIWQFHYQRPVMASPAI